MLTVFELIHFFTVKAATTMTMIGPVVFVLLSACGLIFAAPTPWLTSLINPPPLYSTSRSLPSPSETAESEWIGGALARVGGHLARGGGALGKSFGKSLGRSVVDRAVNKFIDRNLCEKREAELQDDTNVEERSAKLVALAQIMDEIGAAKETLNALEKLSVKDDRMAEAQFNAEINSIRGALRKAGNFIKGAARDIFCR